MDLARRRELERHAVIGQRRGAAGIARELGRAGDEERQHRERLHCRDEAQVVGHAGPRPVRGDVAEPRQNRTALRVDRGHGSARRVRTALRVGRGHASARRVGVGASLSCAATTGATSACAPATGATAVRSAAIGSAPPGLAARSSPPLFWPHRTHEEHVVVADEPGGAVGKHAQKGGRNRSQIAGADVVGVGPLAEDAAGRQPVARLGEELAGEERRDAGNPRVRRLRDDHVVALRASGADASGRRRR